MKGESEIMFNNLDGICKSYIREMVCNDQSLELEDLNESYERYLEESSKELKLMIYEAYDHRSITETMRDSAFDALLNYDMSYLERTNGMLTEDAKDIIVGLNDLSNVYNVFSETGIMGVNNMLRDIQ